MNKSVQRSTVRLLAAVSMLALATATAPAAVYTYDALNQGTLPAAQGWTVAGSQAGTQSITGGDTLSVTDVDGTENFRYYTNAFGVTISSTTEWQTRAMVRVLADSTGTSPLYTQLVDDQTRFTEFGVRYLSDGVGTNRFILNTSAFFIDVPFGPFYEAVLTKTGTTGTGADSLTLQVYDATGTTLLGTTTRPYGLDGFPTFSTTEILEFGNVFSAPTGTFEVQWVAWGIGEEAPFIIPEPSVVGLGLLSGFVAYWKRRRP